ncbi:WD repeat domain-containing protein [Colletotrichum acutatum]|uniref:WD repeat domain-containing protein n=1 Tax=Glomerella acutata TaxID=27357 RepID=A0AAD8XFX2_GLOAC|nr:WD repeat domain-containing protein [Colletotrichum acutatum]KAK1726299.1 WD repeat domain-containing protein [Colletotrichum acutatum]
MSTPTSSAIKSMDAGRREDGQAPPPLPPPAPVSEPRLLTPLSREGSSTAQKSPGGSESQGSSFPTFAKKTPTKLVRSTTPNAKDGKADKPSPVAVQSPAAIDPLSHHILMRTNTGHTVPPQLRKRPDSPTQVPEQPTKLPAHAFDATKDKKKGPSFLSRLSMRGGRRREDDEDSVFSDHRIDGTNAQAFGSVIGSGYIPHHKEPPRYIRVKAHSKKIREFNRMFLAQELFVPQSDSKDDTNTTATASIDTRRSNTSGAIWATEFSTDGKYFAAAGKDQVVRVWAVITTHEERRRHEEEENANGASGERLSAPVFRSKPIHEFRGHTGEVLDLSWSKNNFLLSSSMDKTVRLWHISRKECLCTFKHKDFVTSIAFHPTDDRFFLAGSLDSTLRLWSIPDKAVAYSTQLSDLITAVAFSPDGKTAIAGGLSGMCMFHDTEGLKQNSQLHVRSSRGKNAKGSKITGIKTMVIDDEVKVLITSNDSRVRIYNLRDKSLDSKFKGYENTCSQIHADFSDNGQWIVSGSEDKRTYIWSVHSAESDKEKPCEYFDAHSDRVSTAIFAPTKSRQLLGGSGDPLYDLCNPPPVTLMSLEESIASQAGNSDDEKPQIKQQKIKRPEESPAYIEKSKHFDGQILVTTDQSGGIKVFRQDCAYIKRRHENWETGSTFSRRMGGSIVGRSGSVATRTSVGSQSRSRRGSVSRLAAPGGAQLSSDINTWRHGIESGRPSSMIITASQSPRSLSPNKTSRTPINNSASNLASEARKQPYSGSSPPARPQLPASPTSSRASRDRAPSIPPTPSFSFLSADDDESDELRLDPAGASYSFWNLNRWRGISSLRSSVSFSNVNTSQSQVGQGRNSMSTADTMQTSASNGTKASRRKSLGAGIYDLAVQEEHKGTTKSIEAAADKAEVDEHLLQPDNSRVGNRLRNSVVSRLSSEYTSEDGEQMTCQKCASKDFKPKRVGGRQRLICVKCGKLADDGR